MLDRFNEYAGDVDLDGIATIIDAMVIAQYDVELPIIGGRAAVRGLSAAALWAPLASASTPRR